MAAGASILEMIWAELDDVMVELRKIPRTKKAAIGEEREARGHLRGQALGLATAIAIITNPYNPDIDAVREQAAQRYEEAH